MSVFRESVVGVQADLGDHSTEMEVIFKGAEALYRHHSRADLLDSAAMKTRLVGPSLPMLATVADDQNGEVSIDDTETNGLLQVSDSQEVALDLAA